MDLISVIIPIYKVEKYLRQCIDSVVMQTYNNLEIILVDDGSPDSCPQICDEYAAKDDRILVIHKTNAGLSDARNKGLDIATGKYIVFVDSDDFISLDMIEKLHSSIVNNKADLAICDIKIVDEEGKETLEDIVPLTNTIWTRADFWHNFYYNNHCIQCVVAWNKMYKKSIIHNVRYDLGKIHEDEFIIDKIISQCNKISVMEMKLYSYRKRDDSITGEKYSCKNLDILEAYINRAKRGLMNQDYLLYKDTLKFAVGNYIKAYSNLEYICDDGKKRYIKLRKQFIVQYFRGILKPISLKFKLSTLTFVISEKCYLFYIKLKYKIMFYNKEKINE